MARATDSPSEVLPTPGGPASASTAPLRRPPTRVRPLSARRLRTARYSMIRSLTSSSPAWSASRIARAPRDVVGVVAAGVPRDLQHRVQPGADPAALGRGVGGALQLGRFLHRGLVHLLRQGGGLDPGPVVLFLGARLAVQLSQLLADRGQLLAEQELALLLLHALADVVLDGLRDVQLGQLVPGPPGQQLQPLLGVDGLQQLLALLQGQVAGVPGAVGQRGRVGDPLQHVHDLPRAPLLQDGGGQPAVLAGQLMGAGAGGAARPPRSPRPTGPRRGRWCRRRSAPGPGRG